MAITLFTVVLLLPFVVVTAFFALEVFAGLKPLVTRSTKRSSWSAAIVVPAHDEEAMIGGTIAALVDETKGEFRLLVVADNCSDSTGERARLAGAEVIVRNDPGRRGKGFALAAARDHLRTAPPDVVLIVDADCRLDRASLESLAAAALEIQRPAQAVYLFSPDSAASPMVQISSFAFMLKNLVRQRGLQRLAGRAHLVGTGMAFPWQLFDQAGLGDSNIVEDLAIGLELAQRGAPPMLVPNANVWSQAASQADTVAQRTRWEGGYLATALRMVPRLIGSGSITAALDLMVPPLALLAFLNSIVLVLALMAVAVGAALWPVVVQIVVCTAAGLAVLLAWHRDGRPYISASALARVPAYVLWKLPMYLGLARRGAPREWLRTGR